MRIVLIAPAVHIMKTVVIVMVATATAATVSVIATPVVTVVLIVLAAGVFDFRFVFTDQLRIHKRRNNYERVLCRLGRESR